MRRFFIFAALLIFAHTATADDTKSIARLSKALASLSPQVDPGEAHSVARTAHVTAHALAQGHRVVGPPIFQNFLIHLGSS